jgi:hypothetical protein
MTGRFYTTGEGIGILKRAEAAPGSMKTARTARPEKLQPDAAAPSIREKPFTGVG